MNNNRIRPEDIRRYDVIYYDALQIGQGKRSKKNRPFLVTNVRSDSIECIPITHTAPKKESVYSRFNVKAEENVNKELNKMTNKTTGESYFEVGDEVRVKMSSFKSKQLPKLKGHLDERVHPRELRTQMKKIDKGQLEIRLATFNYQDEKHMFGKVYDYKNRSFKKELLSDKDLKKLLFANKLGTKSKFNKKFQPANKHKTNRKPKPPTEIELE